MALYKFLDHKTLVFDLDETLIHCNEAPDDPSDIFLPVTFPSGDIVNVEFVFLTFANLNRQE